MAKASIIATCCLILALALPATLAADLPEMAECKLSFTLKGWSAFYKSARGEGVVTCDNGQRAEVKIRVKGGGLTVGKSEILDGSGRFSDVLDISEVFGSYVAAEAHAGAVRSAGAQAMTKGEVSLALAGVGRGVDLGVAVTKFTIKPKH